MHDRLDDEVECKSLFLLNLFNFMLVAIQNGFAIYFLTNISLMAFLWDIGKQNSPRCDAAKRGYSVCLHDFHGKMK